MKLTYTKKEFDCILDTFSDHDLVKGGCLVQDYVYKVPGDMTETKKKFNIIYDPEYREAEAITLTDDETSAFIIFLKWYNSKNPFPFVQHI